MSRTAGQGHRVDDSSHRPGKGQHDNPVSDFGGRVVTLTVTRVQHTSFRIESSTTAVVIDPAIDPFNDMWSTRGESASALPLLHAPDAVLVTHAHTDHFHPPTLMGLDRDVMIAVPREDLAESNRMATELAALGFGKVLEVAPGDVLRVGDVTITVVDSPESIEGTTQLSYLLEFGDVKVLHAADALEGFGRNADGALQHLDLALLPLNVSLNASNLRNQMSPATFLQALRELQPQAVVPLGTNEGERRPHSPVRAPWFPFGNPHLCGAAFEALIGGFNLIQLKDGDRVVLEKTAEACQYIQLPESHAGRSGQMEAGLGRIRALLYDVHSRSRADFFLDASMGFDQWRTRWLASVASVSESSSDAGALIDATVGVIPCSRWASPPGTVFRTSLAEAELAHPGTHARILWALGDAEGEYGFLQQAYEVICGELADSQSKWRATVEYLVWLQSTHRRTRPPDPRMWTETTEAEWWDRQLAADIQAADFVYPVFNPLFGPFEVDGEWCFVAIEARTGTTPRAVRFRVPAEHSAWIGLIARADGTESLSALFSKNDGGAKSYAAFCNWLVTREPYAIDTHWLPGHRWSWKPRFDAIFNGKDHT